jgi:acetylornithine deacetylase
MSDLRSILETLELNEERYIGLLTNLISVTERLQNNPAQGLVPREDLASDFVLELLKPYSKENGGVLEIERISYVEGRGNVIIKYPGTTDKVCSFVGSHLDVVPADPKGWSRYPFKLEREGDLLFGRGTTDCLGHVALLTDLMATLAEKKPSLECSIYVVFIANEENALFPGIGIDQLAKEGHMDVLKSGPLFWIDSADSQPCMGTCGMVQWRLECTGKLFHSGLPHKGINAIEMATDMIAYVQKRFYEDFPRHEKEDVYNFVTSSTLKPTQISCTPGSLNQLPPLCTVEGDVRLCPFYDVADVRAKLIEYVEAINKDPRVLEVGAHGPHSKYVIDANEKEAEVRGGVKLTFVVVGENGIACNIDSIGFKSLQASTEKVLGAVVPYSIGGSLPLVRELQEQGFDVMISGYGFSSKYHADNEAVSLSAMQQAFKILSGVVANVEENSA